MAASPPHSISSSSSSYLTSRGADLWLMTTTIQHRVQCQFF